MTADKGALACGHQKGHSPDSDLLHLRVLATSDLHMHLLPYDYLSDMPCTRHGLARTAALIQQRRAEAESCLLLDNGDFLQGTPIGDLSARTPARPHPAIAVMNALNYDAVALGNHDFNYGLRFLRRVVAQARFPVLSANLVLTPGPQIRPWTLIDRRLRDAIGREHLLRIGVVGFLPPQTAEWDQDLTPWMRCDDIVETARRVVPLMREQGAQIVIALAHSGIGPLLPHPRIENAATALAALPGIDVVIAGHTHEVFPGPRAPSDQGIDPERGTLAGKPAVMPGYGGSHLGVIDLDLKVQPAGGVAICGFQVRCEAVDPALRPVAAAQQPVIEAHRATQRHLRSRVGRSEVPLCSHFALLGQDAGLRLINQAQRWHIRQRLRGTCWRDLPVLSACAPFRAGGRGGPDNYCDIAAGALTLRHLADLYAFPNRITAVLITGAQVAEWLERAASLFARIPAGSRDLPLLDPGFPAYNFDVIDGVTWQIDLSAPARYRPDGTLSDQSTRRIRQLTYRGRPVTTQDRFILATNTYRLAGCGLFSPLVRDSPVLLRRGALTRDVLRAYIRRRRRVAPAATAHWRFVPQPGTTVLFPTSPAARPRELVGTYAPEPLSVMADGFALMRLFL
ncbi:MAG: bifunctional 2',3'-cyclic-nucleotide 2'-phosphodiesterase/3'-nucleotidase [Paracoccus sp. (in: a-proteobacteria)]|uniref:bifunctional 2',3'-cyclic-nucleotide 2'-phosphodiesterase/3'-nucleotidase n=1 Tax=Paracoccus sp. TaxID=267 RepID=UPI00391B173B